MVVGLQDTSLAKSRGRRGVEKTGIHMKFHQFNTEMCSLAVASQSRDGLTDLKRVHLPATS